MHNLYAQNRENDLKNFLIKVEVHPALFLEQFIQGGGGLISIAY